MGFLDAICDLGSSFIEGCKSVVRGIASIGAKVVAVAEPLIHILAKVAPAIGVPLGAALAVAKTVVGAAAVAVGIMDATESVEDLGERALEAGEIGLSMDDFENPEDYLREIREIPLNENREKYSDEERRLAGISVLSTTLFLNNGVSPDIYGLFVQYQSFFTPERVSAYMKYAEDSGCSINDVRDFFSSNATFEEKKQAHRFLVEGEKRRVSDFDSDAFEEELFKAKSSSPCVL